MELANVPTCVKLVEKKVDLLEIPADSREFIFLDYDASTLRLRCLVTVLTDR
ncbi:MAG: hypothetical protein IAI50_06090 [Candidatus Eremiobacteraeota bacterium]|nr:hypothetical protein [Candidatus Eremiobacteraeota bacterium]